MTRFLLTVKKVAKLSTTNVDSFAYLAAIKVCICIVLVAVCVNSDSIIASDRNVLVR